jgi:predicted transcriptional regulator
MIVDLYAYTNFTIRVATVPVKLGLTVTDRYLSLGLYGNDKKTYDSSSDLISRNPSALSWGEELFSYFRERSQLLVL